METDQENIELTPVAQVVQLIKKNIKIFEPFNLKSEHVYSYGISRNDSTNTDPIVVVSELKRAGHTYGNGAPIYERRRIQITFYYPKDYQGPEEGLEQKLRSFLLEYRYFCYSNAGHVMTPDSQNLTNTLKFNHTKEII